MQDLFSSFFQKNADLASIASVGAAVGIGILFVFALHKWSVPSRAQEAVPRRVREYSEELGIHLPNENVDSWNADRYIEEISRVLEFRFFDQQGIESLPGGHSWVELARTVISSRISPDLTDVDILANAYCILMEKGPCNEIMTEALKILLLWQQGLSIS
jgi:hypothetical protein